MSSEVQATYESLLGKECELPLGRRLRRGFDYFLENQDEGSGLFLDNQANHGPRDDHGLCSMSATGLGAIVLALAAREPYGLLQPDESVRRILRALQTVRDRLPHEEGIVPHFVDSQWLESRGEFSVIDSALLAAGAQWASQFLREPQLQAAAHELYDRIHWRNWSCSEGPHQHLLRHGKSSDRKPLAPCWDRLNGETAFAYVLAAGAADDRALSRDSWLKLRPFLREVDGLPARDPDLGLFAHWSDLVDFDGWTATGAEDFIQHAKWAVELNLRTCRRMAADFPTYERFWGLSPGYGPGPGGSDRYWEYAPSGDCDGTANLMIATAGAIRYHTAAAMQNVLAAEAFDRERGEGDPKILGRYGDSNINVSRDRVWIAQRVVGNDVATMLIAVDNFFMNNRVSETFSAIPCVARGMERLEFKRRPPEAGLSEVA